jgi:hypothetical protein
MMTSHAKRCLDAAIDELKRNGYSVLLLMFDHKSDEALPMGSAMEILCSETNDPRILKAMALDALRELSHPKEVPADRAN